MLSVVGPGIFAAVLLVLGVVFVCAPGRVQEIVIAIQDRGWGRSRWANAYIRGRWYQLHVQACGIIMLLMAACLIWAVLRSL
jgi:hypothetical protein